MNTTTRTLRLSPRDLMTGDLLVERAYRGGVTENVVTWIEPQQSGRFWSITTLGADGGSTAIYAVQRRVTVKRSGPKGLGE